jgi:hypothetical protein
MTAIYLGPRSSMRRSASSRQSIEESLGLQRATVESNVQVGATG